jgi:hypothetical protein
MPGLPQVHVGAVENSTWPLSAPNSTRSGNAGRAQDTERIEPLFEEFYLPVLSDAAKEARLRAIGQLPEKDLARLFRQVIRGDENESRGPNKPLSALGETLANSGRRPRNDDAPRNAGPLPRNTDHQLLDARILRPIERAIFQQTRDWLRADPANELILVLDEAHMYRGAGGAEVALLLRRLLSRLDVPRDRVRFILTSASLGTGDEATRAVTQFGRDFTGLPDESARSFEVVRGTREVRGGERAGTPAEAQAFHAFDLSAFEKHATDPATARRAVTGLCQALGWNTPSGDSDLADFLFESLTGFGPLELLIQSVSGAAGGSAMFHHRPAVLGGCGTASARSAASD